MKSRTVQKRAGSIASGIIRKELFPKIGISQPRSGLVGYSIYSFSINAVIFQHLAGKGLIFSSSIRRRGNGGTLTPPPKYSVEKRKKTGENISSLGKTRKNKKN